MRECDSDFPSTRVIVQVRITTEWVTRVADDRLADFTIAAGLEKRPKLTYNVLPTPPSQRFTLTTLV